MPVRVPTLTSDSDCTAGLEIDGRPVVWLIGTPSRKKPAEFTRLPFLSTVNEPARVKVLATVVLRVPEVLTLLVTGKRPRPVMPRSVRDADAASRPCASTLANGRLSTPPGV